jgi:tetratricopeptide (TPR) repeat protein
VIGLLSSPSSAAQSAALTAAGGKDSKVSLASVKARQKTPGDLAEVDRLIAVGSLLQARQRVDSLLKIYPDDWQVALTAARLYRKMGLSSYAILEYERVRGARPLMSEPLVALSEIHLENLSTELAQRLAREAVYLDPKSREARLALVSALLAGQSVSQAREQAEALAQKFPGDPEVEHVLANAAQAFGENDKALNLMILAVQARPAEQTWLLELAALYEANQDYTKAEACLKTALARDGQDVRALDALAHLYEFKLLDYARARSCYSALRALLPDSASAQAGMDRCLVKQGDLALSFRNFIRRVFGYRPKENTGLQNQTEEPAGADSSVFGSHY